MTLSQFSRCMWSLFIAPLCIFLYFMFTFFVCFGYSIVDNGDKFCSVDKQPTKKTQTKKYETKMKKTVCVWVLWCHLIFLSSHMVAKRTSRWEQLRTHSVPFHCYWSFTSWLLLSFYYNIIYIYFISTILFSHNTLNVCFPVNYP